MISFFFFGLLMNEKIWFFVVNFKDFYSNEGFFYNKGNDLVFYICGYVEI